MIDRTLRQNPQRNFNSSLYSYIEVRVTYNVGGQSSVMDLNSKRLHELRSFLSIFWLGPADPSEGRFLFILFPHPVFFFFLVDARHSISTCLADGLHFSSTWRSGGSNPATFLECKNFFEADFFPFLWVVLCMQGIISNTLQRIPLDHLSTGVPRRWNISHLGTAVSWR